MGVHTRGNVFAIQWRMSSTVWDFQYGQGYLQCFGGCSVLRRDAMRIMEGYHQYCGGFSVLWRETISTEEEIHTKVLGFPSTVLNILHGADAILPLQC